MKKHKKQMNAHKKIQMNTHKKTHMKTQTQMPQANELLKPLQL